MLKPIRKWIFRLLAFLAALNLLLVLGSGVLVIFSFRGEKHAQIAQVKELGEKIYAEYSCAGCHGVDGNVPAIPAYPSIRHQSADYNKRQIIDIRDGTRNNGFSSVMKSQIQRMSDEEAEVVARYLEILSSL